MKNKLVLETLNLMGTIDNLKIQIDSVKEQLRYEESHNKVYEDKIEQLELSNSRLVKSRSDWVSHYKELKEKSLFQRIFNWR